VFAWVEFLLLPAPPYGLLPVNCVLTNKAAGIGETQAVRNRPFQSNKEVKAVGKETVENIGCFYYYSLSPPLSSSSSSLYTA
jgi:hypothetical protein